MGFLLLIIALILIFGLSIVNYFFVENKKGYFRSTALNLDRFANREFRAFWNKILIKPFGYKFGNINESVSEVLGYNIIWNQLKKPGVFLVQLLSIKHCIEALPTEIKTMYNNQINEIMESQPKSIIEKLKTTFTTGKGWQHLLFFWSLIYVLMYWAATDYAQTTNLWPSSMLASLHNQVLLLQFIAYVFVVAYLGSREIEFWEALLFKAKFSNWDINWGTIGGFLGFLNYLYMPQSKILFYLFIALDVILLVKFLTTFFKKK